MYGWSGLRVIKMTTMSTVRVDALLTTIAFSVVLLNAHCSATKFQRHLSVSCQCRRCLISYSVIPALSLRSFTQRHDLYNERKGSLLMFPRRILFVEGTFTSIPLLFHGKGVMRATIFL